MNLNKAMHFFRLFFCIILSTIIVACSTFNTSSGYPRHWWKEVPRAEAKWWEILPQDASINENTVVLSKRNELGILSNFANTPFVFDEKKYFSVEGFWQMLKFPEDKEDVRNKFLNIKWKQTREDVSQMYSFEAKRSGYEADQNMELMGINWVTYKSKKIAYKEEQKGQLYQLIKEVMWAKLNANPKVKSILISTKGLQLKSDHKILVDAPPSWKYHEIWMEIRQELLAEVSLNKVSN